MPNSQQRLVPFAVMEGASAWERHDLLLMLLLMLLADAADAAGCEAFPFIYRKNRILCNGVTQSLLRKAEPLI